MDVSFSQPCCCDLHEARFGPHGDHVATPQVAHAGPQTTDQLMNIKGERALIRHLPFNPLRDQLLRVFHICLAVAVSASLTHGTERTHSAINLVSSPLIENRFPGALFSPREKAADHHRIRASSQRLCYIAGKFDPAVGDDGHVTARRGFSATANRRNLRHANAGYDTGRANGTRPDTDLDYVDACVYQGRRSLVGGDVAAGDIKINVAPPNLTHRIEDILRVTMRRVYREQVYSGSYQRLHSFFPVGANADGRTDAQPAPLIFTGIRVLNLFLNIFNRDQSLELEVLVHY